MVFRARGLHRRPRTEGEYIVRNEISRSIVLVKGPTAMGVDAGAIPHKVALDAPTSAAFIRVNSPSAIIVGANIVNHVAHATAPGTDTQGINASHVAQDALADLVNAVVTDDIVRRKTPPITPRPADRNSRVKGVADIVVRDLIIRALANPDANSAGMNPTASRDDVVVDDGFIRALFGIVPHDHFTNPNASRAEIREQRMLHPALMAIPPKPDTVSSGVANFTICKSHALGIVNFDCRSNS